MVTNKSEMHKDILFQIGEEVMQWTEILTMEIDTYKKFAPENFLQETNQLSKFIDKLTLFVEFLTMSSLYLHKTRPSNNYLPIKLHLLAVLKALQVSIKTNDSVAAHDLLTEELRDNLIEWKITLIPHLKSTPHIANNTQHFL